MMPTQRQTHSVKHNIQIIEQMTNYLVTIEDSYMKTYVAVDRFASSCKLFVYLGEHCLPFSPASFFPISNITI